MATVHPSRMGLVPTSGDDRHSRVERDSYGTPVDSNRRRASPDYNEYRRPSPPRNTDYHPDDRDNSSHGYRSSGRTAPDFMERYVSIVACLQLRIVICHDSRRLQREEASVDIWPPSPKAPIRSL
jgi:hypothetical protein